MHQERKLSCSQLGEDTLAIEVGDVTAVDVTQSTTAAQFIR
jgi:hypothetical protein